MITRAWKDIDKYSSYMSIGVHSANYSQKICNGKFYDFLKNNFNIEKLPYDIKLLDLLLKSPSSYELYVQLPKELFQSWKNYPLLHAEFNELTEDLEVALYFDCHLLSIDSFELKDLIHPYDSKFKEVFVKKYKKAHPISSLEKLEHKNGRIFYSCEIYLAHWRAYVLIETIVECKFIEKYVDFSNGKEIFLEEFWKKNKEWTEKYKTNLDIVSTYKTVSSRLGPENSQVYFHKNLLDFLNIDIKKIEEIIENLLTIYQKFRILNENKKIKDFDKALNLLRLDIYLMVEWLERLGTKRSDIYEKWSYDSRISKTWDQLIDVLPRKEFIEKSRIIQYSENYLDQNIFKKWLAANDLNIKNIVEIFLKLQTSEVWARIFVQLHESIHSNQIIRFDTPLILDSLLVLTIRTESILKERLEKLSGESTDLLKDVFQKLAPYSNHKNNKVLTNIQTLMARDRELTRLSNKPHDILDKVKFAEMPKNLDQCSQHFIRAILKVITLRNYFAHHSYKDDELSSINSPLGRETLEACLTTIIFVLGAR